MEQLVHELQTLEKYMSHYVSYVNNYKDKNKFKEAFIRHKVNKILSYADTYLIKSNGQCNWDNIEILGDKGYYVGPGERDRFGWLSGVIGTSKGDIVYG